jgi:hypothetical protein
MYKDSKPSCQSTCPYHIRQQSDLGPMSDFPGPPRGFRPPTPYPFPSDPTWGTFEMPRGGPHNIYPAEKAQRHRQVYRYVIPHFVNRRVFGPRHGTQGYPGRLSYDKSTGTLWQKKVRFRLPKPSPSHRQVNFHPEYDLAEKFKQLAIGDLGKRPRRCSLCG